MNHCLAKWSAQPARMLTSEPQLCDDGGDATLLMRKRVWRQETRLVECRTSRHCHSGHSKRFDVGRDAVFNARGGCIHSWSSDARARRGRGGVLMDTHNVPPQRLTRSTSGEPGWRSVIRSIPSSCSSYEERQWQIEVEDQIWNARDRTVILRSSTWNVKV